MVATLTLSQRDQADLAGSNGNGLRWAMEMLVAVADAFGARELIDISSAHLVGAYHSGPANLALLDSLIVSGARVRVPTTLSASSADLTDSAPPCYAGLESSNARAVVERGLALGCAPALTCAPYFLSGAPKRGQFLAWAESNAVLYANTVIGARTLRTPQFLDLACALAGRAPLIGPLTDAGRAPSIRIDLSSISPEWFASSMGPELVGFLVGERAGAEVPILTGLSIKLDTLAMRSLCAGAGVSGAFAILHIEGSSPEAHQWLASAIHLPTLKLTDQDLQTTTARYQSDPSQPVAAGFLGAPHFGAEDINRLDALLPARLARPLYVSISRMLPIEPAQRARLEATGIRFVHDACTYYGPITDDLPGVAVTNSIKWAAYAANRGIKVQFTSLEGAIHAASTGCTSTALPNLGPAR